MNRLVFVDTAFWVWFFDIYDQNHTNATEIAKKYNHHTWVTTDAVLYETLNYFSRSGITLRQHISAIISSLFSDKQIEIVTSSKNWLLATSEFYHSRADKAWSGVDCF